MAMVLARHLVATELCVKTPFVSQAMNSGVRFGFPSGCSYRVVSAEVFVGRSDLVRWRQKSIE